MTRAVMQQALEALEEHEGNYKLGKSGCERQEKAITALRKALAQPVQEPMRVYVENFAAMGGWVKDSGEGAFNYVQRISYAQGVEDATAHARPVQEPLDDWDIDALRHNIGVDIDPLWARKFARAIEAKLKGKTND